MKSVGRPLPHDAAHLHVTGQARYVDDIPSPAGTLHLAFGLSQTARGRITGLNLDAVRRAPGVAVVLTAADLPFANDVSPSIHDEELLASREVFYCGQPVFLVAATSHRAARKAARKARIDVEDLPAILSIDAALAADSRFEEAPLVWQKGDAASAIAAAPHVVAGRIEIGGQEHFYLEGQAALALPQENGDMEVHSSTQHPSEIQHKAAEALGLALNAVRVLTRRMGGGFGGKESQGNALAVACALVAQVTGRPAKMRYDRDDDFTITGKRHDFRIAYRAGHDAEGRIRGVEFTQLARCGWAQDLSLAVADRAMLHADNAYLIDDIRIESHRLKTHTQSATAFRGFGGPQGMLGIERVLDHVAHAVGRDPVAVRRLNYYAEAHADTPGGASPPGRPESISGKMKEKVAPGGQTTPYEMPVTDFILGGITERLLETSDYAARRQAVDAWNAGGSVIRKGLGFVPVKFGISFTLTHLNQAGALVHVYQDGTVALNHGGTEMGQGLYQKVVQVAAERFGIDPDRVRINATDTGKVPNTSATAASSGTDLNGMAVAAACDKIRDRIADYLGREYGPGPAAFEDGLVRIGNRTLSFAEAAQAAYRGRVSLSATGFYRTPGLDWNRVAGRGTPFFYFAYGAALTEVAVDTLTGEHRTLRTDILHDAGATLNPAIDIGQIEGGYVQGVGWLTSEELVWDAAGRLRTHAPSTYKIPACSDRPDVFNVALFEGRNPRPTVYRSKAVGEPPLMLGIAALLALSDAVASCGSAYPALDAPATPERVLAAIARVRGS